MSKHSKVVLVDISWSFGNVGPSMGYIFSLPYMLSVLQNKNIDASFVEFFSKEAQEAKTYKEFIKFENEFINKVIKTSKDADLIIISSSSTSYTYGNYGRALRVAEACGNEYSDAMIVVGGSFIKMLDMSPKTRFQPFLDSKHIDVLIHGEGEGIIDSLYKAAKDKKLLNKIPNISYRKNSNSFIRNDSLFLSQAELSNLPLINWNSFNWDNGKRPYSLFTSRGCAYRCSFCFENILGGGRYRFFNHKKIFAEILRAYKLGLSKMNIEDSTFLSYPQMEDLCDDILNEQVNISWSAWGTCRDILNQKDKLKKIHKAGCKSLVFGVESVNDEINKYTQGVFKVDKTTALQAIELLQKNNIITQATFIAGLPGESLDDMKATFKYGSSLPIDYYRWHIYSPDWWSDNVPVLDSQNRINPSDWKKVELDVPLHILPEILEHAPAYSWCESHTLIRLLFSLDKPMDRMSQIKLAGKNLQDIFNLLKIELASNNKLFCDESELSIKPIL
ncbi:MAG: B12-binding domain-containing radical SAM protein [Patescibacteria group bacterium]|nr:B12-binding domain-containing radical SAM protein [Patescibacteria group bacterium]